MQKVHALEVPDGKYIQVLGQQCRRAALGRLSIDTTNNRRFYVCNGAAPRLKLYNPDGLTKRLNKIPTSVQI